MRSLRVTFILAGLFVLPASTLSAQSSRVSCKDGTLPKVGHFSCWGHGGLVTGALKSAPKTDAPTATKTAKKHEAASKATKSTKKAHSPTAKAEKKSKKKPAKKTHAKRAAKDKK